MINFNHTKIFIQWTQFSLRINEHILIIIHVYMHVFVNIVFLNLLIHK